MSAMTEAARIHHCDVGAVSRRPETFACPHSAVYGAYGVHGHQDIPPPMGYARAPGLALIPH
jgi:hypothetical protein